jgi:hypothetical protein
MLPGMLETMKGEGGSWADRSGKPLLGRNFIVLSVSAVPSFHKDVAWNAGDDERRRGFLG